MLNDVTSSHLTTILALVITRPFSFLPIFMSSGYLFALIIMSLLLLLKLRLGSGSRFGLLLIYDLLITTSLIRHFSY